MSPDEVCKSTLDMKKIIKSIIKMDLDAIGFANVVCDILINHYGKHNYEDFKRVVLDRLK